MNVASLAVSEAKKYFTDSKFLGLSGAIIDKADTRLFSYGKRNPVFDNPFTEDSISAIGSLTKIFTAVLIIQARRRGLLGLDDQAARLLSKSGISANTLRDVTILDLITHTSGLPRDLKGKFFETGVFPTNQNLGLEMDKAGIDSMPRRRYRYSNLGFALLGMVLENAAGFTYADLLESWIAKPLGVKDLFLNISDQTEAGYRYDQTKNFIAQPVYNLGSYTPTGAIWTSASTMAKFIAALVHSPSTLGLLESDVDRMFSVYFINQEMNVGPGFAWRYIALDGQKFFSHSGSVPGYGSTVIASRDSGRAVILLSNSDAFHFPGAHAIYKKLLSKDGPPEVYVAPANANDYVGEYFWLDPERKLRLEIDIQGQLWLPETSYKPLVDDTFFKPLERDKFLTIGGFNDGEVSIFERNQTGIISGMWLGGLFYSKSK